MRYYWILIIVIILPLIIIGFYHSTIFNFLASTNPFPERVILIVLIIVTAIVGIPSLLVHFLERKKIPILEFNIFTKTNDTKNTVYFVRVKNTSGEGMAENVKDG